MLLKIAWRNIWRNKLRSIVVMTSVAIGLFAGMFMMAFGWGIVQQEIHSTIETQLSHIQIHNPSFSDDKLVDYTIDNGPAIITQLKNDSRVKAVSGRIIAQGMVSSASMAAGANIIGIVPEDEESVSTLHNYLLEGEFFSEEKKNEIVIGKKLSQKLKVKLHSKIVLTFQSKSGEITASSFRIEGIFQSQNSVFDETNVFARFADFAPLLGTGNDLHEIAILLKDDQSVQPVTSELKKQFPQLLIQKWVELSPLMQVMITAFDQIMYIVIGIILLALMFGIINTMLMAVLERQREFGMLMAIGMNKSRVFIMIVLEALMLTCVGIPIGMLFTIGAVDYLGKTGINLSMFSQALAQIGMGNIIYPQIHSTTFIPITLMTAFTAILSAIYPAIKALRLKPIEAIHKI